MYPVGRESRGKLEGGKGGKTVITIYWIGKESIFNKNGKLINMFKEKKELLDLMPLENKVWITLIFALSKVEELSSALEEFIRHCCIDFKDILSSDSELHESRSRFQTTVVCRSRNGPVT